MLRQGAGAAGVDGVNVVGPVGVGSASGQGGATIPSPLMEENLAGAKVRNLNYVTSTGIHKKKIINPIY